MNAIHRLMLYAAIFLASACSGGGDSMPAVSAMPPSSGPIMPAPPIPDPDDLDQDGLVDAEDLDDDGDGVPDDVDRYPRRPGCSGEFDGDGTQCYLESNQIEWRQSFVDADGILYLTSLDLDDQVLRWDTDNLQFIAPLELNVPEDKRFLEMKYSAPDNRLFLNYVVVDEPSGNAGSGSTLSYIDLSAIESGEVIFIDDDVRSRIQILGEYLLRSATDIAVDSDFYTVFDSTTLSSIATADRSDISYSFFTRERLHPLFDRGYFFRSDTLQFEEFFSEPIERGFVNNISRDVDYRISSNQRFLFDSDFTTTILGENRRGHRIIEIDTQLTVAEALDGSNIITANTIGAQWTDSGVVVIGSDLIEEGPSSTRTEYRILSYDADLNLVSETPSAFRLVDLFKISASQSDLILVRKRTTRIAGRETFNHYLLSVIAR